MLALLAACAAIAADGVELVRLANDRVVVEVAPRLGGRIVTLRRPDGQNILGTLPQLLATPADQLPRAAADGPFLPGNGAIVWMGPQAQWWTQQEANAERRDAHATWPPDPWLEYGAMAVVARTPDSLRLAGPASPVTGMRLSLNLRITPDGAVSERISAVNTSARTVTWDLWPNTRVRPDARVLAPYTTGTRLRIEYGTWDPAAEQPLPQRVVDGYCTFDSRFDGAAARILHTGKIFLASSASRLFAVAPGEMLVMVAPTPAAGTVHPDHAPVEVYQCAGGDPIRALLELEFHSACRTLAPGEAIDYAVAWQVLPVPAAADDAALAALAKAHEPDAARLRVLVE